MKKINWKTLIIAVLIPLTVGGLSALISMGAMRYFSDLSQPPLSPPAVLFPIVWTLLYILMGIASYLVLEANVHVREKFGALKLYGLQLVFNFFWSIIFFNFELYEVAFGWLLVLLALVVITTLRFARINKTAGLLFLPYIAWLLFAAYLNIGVAILN